MGSSYKINVSRYLYQRLCLNGNIKALAAEYILLIPQRDSVLGTLHVKCCPGDKESTP